MKNHACAIVTHGHHTDIAIKVYSNRVFLIVTHFKKLGSLITVTKEAALNRFSGNTFSTKVLFGRDDIEIVAAARYIAEQIDVSKPLLISLSLKEYDSETLNAIVSAINNIKPW